MHDNQALHDFIAKHAKPYDPATDDYERPPFAADIKEGKNDPIYNAHSYHTKVPPRSIIPYILHYTQPGDLVLDLFCGSGMTGVAAQMCAQPPAEFWKRSPNSKTALARVPASSTTCRPPPATSPTTTTRRLMSRRSSASSSASRRR